MVAKGVLDSKEIMKKMEEILLKDVTALEYVAIVDRAFHRIDKVEKGNTIILVAAFVGATRLIDNIWL